MSLTAATKAEMVSRIAARVHLTDALQTRVKNLSGGEARRLSIACELTSNSRLLFLDEPTSGLIYFEDKYLFLLCLYI